MVLASVVICVFSVAEPADECHRHWRVSWLHQRQLELGQRRANIVIRRPVSRQAPHQQEWRGGWVARDGGRAEDRVHGARPSGVHRLRTAGSGGDQHRTKSAERECWRHNRRTRSVTCTSAYGLSAQPPFIIFLLIFQIFFCFFISIFNSSRIFFKKTYSLQYGMTTNQPTIKEYYYF